MVGGHPAHHDQPRAPALVGRHQESRAVRTIKLCASPNAPHAPHAGAHPTTLLEAIRRSAIEIERSGRVRRPLPEPARNAPTALA